jgi:hypothetical protein
MPSYDEDDLVDEAPLRIVTVMQESTVTTRKDLWQTFIDGAYDVGEALIGLLLRQLFSPKNGANCPIEACNEVADESPLPIRTEAVHPAPIPE